MELEYKQKQCNLIFEGISDAPNESDVDAIHKVRAVLRGVQGLDSRSFVIDRCYRLDGVYKQNSSRQILCTLNWQREAQIILKNCKYLPKGVYVNEDFPEEWVDRHRVLHPIFLAAKKSENLKHKTYFTKDRLVIDGKSYLAVPSASFLEVSKVLDIAGTCQKSDADNIVFLGCHSVFSNLHSASFVIDNTTYNCAEQCIQSAKAALFDDDMTQACIMRESNPYKMKKLGSKVRNFNADKWKKSAKQIAYAAAYTKFQQNPLLCNILINTGDVKIAEGSVDVFWGTGFHLHDQKALDHRYWKNEGGVMSEIYSKIQHELKKE